MNNLVVYCEIEAGHVAEVSLELLTKARSLAKQLACQVEAVAIGAQMDGVEQQVAPFGVDVLHLFESERLAYYTTRPYASILTQLFKEEKPQICLMGASVQGRDLGPRVSSANHSGLTADCTSLEIGDYTEKDKHYPQLLYQIRPAFGGNIVATIVNPECRPQMATVREGVMKKQPLSSWSAPKVIRHKVADYVNDSDFAIKVLDRRIEKLTNKLSQSSIVIAGGYGMGTKENFQLLYELAAVLNAEVGASRAAVDAGFCDSDRQIGQTGMTVRPKLYIACGISGQIQHLAGMQESALVIAINTDPQAPINAVADYVIHGKAEEVIPKMIKYYKKNNR